jgi:DNA polymerase-1
VPYYSAVLNTPVQGTAADGFKLALAHLYANRHEVPEARVVAVVHDEILVECPIPAAQETAAWMKRHMEAAMTEVVGGAVPIVAETTIARDWAGTPLEGLCEKSAA